MNVLFLFLWCIDTIMLCFAIESILTHGIGGMVLFASEVNSLYWNSSIMFANQLLVCNLDGERPQFNEQILHHFL